MNSIERVWNDYHSELRSFIGKRTRNAADADDVLQNVFLKICTRLASLREPEKTRGWLYQIAANAAIDYYRAKRPEVPLPEEIGWTELPIKGAGDDECFQKAQSRLAGLVDALPAKYRAAVKLAELEGWTGKRVAARQGISVSGVKSRVQRGRKMIRKMIEDCCRFEFDRRGHPIGCESKRAGKICC